MPTVKTHPLAEIIAKKLFSIETVPKEFQRRMINKAVNAACKYHDKKIKDLEREKQILTDSKNDRDLFINELDLLLKNVDPDYTPSEDWFDKRMELIGE